jgi:hypothetical protein
MYCLCGRSRKPRSGLSPDNDPHALSRKDSLDPFNDLWENGVEDSTGSSTSGSNNEPTIKIHSKKLSRCLSRSGGGNGVDPCGSSDLAPLVSIPQDQVQDVQTYRKSAFSERNDHPTEVWTDEAEPSSTTAENRSPRDIAIAKLQDSNFRTRNSCQGPPARSRSRKNLQVPYIFEFVPFPGHTCTGRGTIPLGKVTISVEGNTHSSHNFQYDSSFQRLLNDYNSRNRRLFATEPVKLHHVTEVSLQSRVEFSASVQLVRDIREKKILVVTLLKRYPGCPECRNRGRLQDVPTP